MALENFELYVEMKEPVVCDSFVKKMSLSAL